MWNLRSEGEGEGRGDFWGPKKKRKTQSITLCLSPSVLCLESVFEQVCTRVWMSNFDEVLYFFSFLLGDSFYSYTTPDKVLSLPVVKLKHFPLPVQRWISLQECTSTDSHFLLDMTELPLLRQLILPFSPPSLPPSTHLPFPPTTPTLKQPTSFL